MVVRNKLTEVLNAAGIKANVDRELKRIQKRTARNVAKPNMHDEWTFRKYNSML